MAQWSGKTKGTLLGYKIFLFSIKVFGLNTAYLILKFVTYYYYLFAKKSRESIRDFYVKALGLSHKEALKLTKKNFSVFGQTLVDRFAFLVNRADKITYSFDNEEALLNLKDLGKGGILMSAHLGNWETAGNLLKHRISSKMNVLMLDAEVQKIKAFTDKSTGGSQFNIIPIKNDFSHLIKLNNAFKAKEFVALHADRFTEGAKSITLDFFGYPVRFPYGPFLIASKFKVPITFVFAIKASKTHYALCATDPIIDHKSPEEIAKAYISEIERLVKKHPEQWFNYYNYFEQ